jgi:DNA-binding CsgD family transcriptional regulator
MRSFICYRGGDLIAAESDSQAAIELAQELVGTEFALLAVAASVHVGLERDEPPDVLRRLVENFGVSYDDEFTPSSQLRYASGVLRAAARDHERALGELLGCGTAHPALGGENPAVLPWRSAAALSLVELGRQDEARALAADEVQRAGRFGAPRAIGMALRVQALVGPARERADLLRHAQSVLQDSTARLEHVRVLADLGASLRSAGERTAAREPLLEALTLSTQCGARALERRVRAELGAIGIRPRTAHRSGADSLTPSERRVAELAAAGGTNREIAQTLFVTEKTVETHLGRAFRKLDISSRRQLRGVLARASA